MALKTFDELRNNIGSTIRETQIESLIGTFVNYTLMEIAQFHPWSWLRRKTTFSTVASQEDYNLDEEVDQIAILRQITSPWKLIQLPDQRFYELVPNPENLATSNPRFYRLWEETGFSTQPTSAEQLQVLSSSTNDGSAFRVAIVGRDSTNNLEVSEEIILNGTTAVTSVRTYAISGLKFCSKSAQTTGTITIRGASSSTVFSRIAPEETAPRFKRLSLYPIPSSAITMYLEYFERVRLLVNDTDVPQLDTKWMWVLREGALSKAWAYKQNEQASALSRGMFEQGLLLMRQQDERNLDYVPVLKPRRFRSGTVKRVSDSISSAFPSYSVGY
jgi:hypothetical protein